MEFLFELICEFLAVIFDPVYSYFTKENRKIKNKTLRKIAKGFVSVVAFIVVVLIYMCLSRLLRGYWV